MYFKINKSGCCEYNGLVQLRIEFFLGESDYGYSKTYIDYPIRDYTEEELDNAELRSLVPLTKKLIPFHNHFVYINPESNIDIINEMCDRLLFEAYSFWEKDEFPNIKNPETEFNPTEEKKLKCIDFLSKL